jgi:hypothetical protein
MWSPSRHYSNWLTCQKKKYISVVENAPVAMEVYVPPWHVAENTDAMNQDILQTLV